jgi:hypothetical protein
MGLGAKNQLPDTIGNFLFHHNGITFITSQTSRISGMVKQKMWFVFNALILRVEIGP